MIEKIRPALNYFGGKYMLAKWIISHFKDHRIYIEPFGGGGSVLLQKNKSKLEIYNDIDCEIYNFFKVLRENSLQLLTLLKNTPYSRHEYLSAREPTLDPIERARRTAVKSMMGIGDSIHNKSGFRNSKTSNCSPSQTFKNYVDQIGTIVDRLRSVIIENLHYLDIIDKYDSVEALFYMDPPYPHSTRTGKASYKHEFSDKDHEIFIGVVKKIKGSVIISSYENDLYDSLGWRKEFKQTKTQKNKRTEVLYIKYPL